jgi:hypothetical protein
MTVVGVACSCSRRDTSQMAMSVVQSNWCKQCYKTFFFDTDVRYLEKWSTSKMSTCLKVNLPKNDQKALLDIFSHQLFWAS